MKALTNRWFMGVVTILFCFQFATAQTYKDTETNEDKVISNEDVSRQVLSSLGIGTSQNVRNSTVQGNSVFLRQIGDFNTVSVNVQTNASEISLIQNGDSNDISLDYLANTAVTDLVQNGDNNRITDFVNDLNADVSLDLIQDGDNLNFERNGANNLTKSLQFKQTEASPTLIIRSYF